MTPATAHVSARVSDLALSPARAACVTPRRLHLILMPTEACNFRCVYCYETFALKRMRADVVAGVKRLLSQRASDLTWLLLSWFGGEPLLAPDIIEDVMGHARGLVEHNPDLSIRADATTNGSLLHGAMADRLLTVGVQEFQISLDGPAAWHDRKRVRPGGGGTFEGIWRNLIALKARSEPFHVTLRIHVDRDNVDAIPDFLPQLGREFGGDDRFDLFIRTVSRLGGPRDGALPILGEDEAPAILRSLRERATQVGLKLAGANSGEKICYAAHANSFLVRADGRLNKCTVALENPANQVGRIREDGTLELTRERVLPWMRGLQSGEAASLACPLHGIGPVAHSDAVTLPIANTTAWALP